VYADVTKAILNALSGKDRQYVLSCSTLGPTIGQLDTFVALKKWFKDLKTLESPRLHRLPASLSIEKIQINDQNACEETDNIGPIESIERLVRIIKSDPKGKFVIFAAFVSRGNALQESLEASGIASAVVFGEMVVEHRVQNMNKYMSGEVRVLIGGEVVSRGLALQTDHVILFDVPHNLGQLLHKVGRTGVLGRPGKVSCFIKPDDESIVKRMLQDEKFEVSYPSRSKRKSTQERNFADAQLDHELSELSD